MHGRISGRTAVALLLVAVAATAFAGRTLVRVEATDYQQLSRHIPFKGTSIEVTGQRPGASYDLMLERSDLPVLQASGLDWNVVVDDVDSRTRELDEFGFYCSYDSYVRTMRNWQTTYPNICKLESLGPTHEGRWLYGVKITDNPLVEEGEVEVLLESQHHAREWAAGQSVRYFCDTLLRNYMGNPDFQSFINNHVLWAFPVVNVDGFVYDYPSQRMWRKNRQPFSSSIGCDENRDYGGACNGNRMDDWGALVSGSRSTHLPSDETFMGGRGAWSYEIAAFANFFRQHTFICDISLHSYSELVLWPYGSGSTAPDNATLASLGQRAAAQMSALGGGTYTPEQSNALYPTSGGSCDWMYGWAKYVGGFPCMSYVFELGTEFYQPVGDLNSIHKECFDGAWFMFRRSDSIAGVLRGFVPRPILASMDSSATGDFTIHWTPIRPAYNQPTKWELEELSGLTVVTDDIESGTGRWTLQGASQSTTQKHSGSYSVFLGTGNNISNYMVTNDPYPVQAGDSLRYWISYNTENNYDVVTTEVSLEGKEWFQLHDRYTGNSSGWVRKAYSLAPWVGKSVFIRFRYMTDDNAQGTGAYIDDVWPVPVFASRVSVNNNITDSLYAVTGKQPGRYWYRVRGYNSLGWSDKGPLEDIRVTGSGVAEQRPARGETRILGLSPNPTSAGVAVRYTLAGAGRADLRVYDATGTLVRGLSASVVERGASSVFWDGRDAGGARVPAGVYYVRLTADRTLTARIAVIR
jgi:hypothetical protein